MWKILYQLASPKLSYEWMGKALPWLKSAWVICLFTGVFWGLVMAPPDYQQGDAFRIIYIHVPSAFLSMGLYAWMGFLSVLILVWRIKLAGFVLIEAARVGLTMAFLALVTGSLWGKPMWGTWWIWDARLTSELILLLLYAGILAVYQSIENKDKAIKMVAVLCLVGLVDLPIIHYSVNWWHTLHQGATLMAWAKPKMPLDMLYPLIATLLGFSCFAFWVVFQRARYEVLQKEKNQSWVKQVILEKRGC